MLSESKIASNSALFESYLSFVKSLLEGGNKKIQSSIYKFFCSVHKSENFFQKIHILFTKQIKKLAENDMVTSITELSSQFMVDPSQVLIKLITMLQQFSENHFEELQNYIRIQKNSRNNYDLVNDIVDLLAAYVTPNNFKKANYEVIYGCLETLEEIIQVNKFS